MRNTLRKRLLLIVAMAISAIMACGVSVSVAAPSHHDGAAAGAGISAKHRHKHPKRGPRGPRGPKGATGPAGPAGANGAPGVGTQFSFALRTNTQTASVLEINGVRLEAGCINGELEFVVRPEGGDHNIVEVTAFDNNTAEVWSISEPEAAVNKAINLLAGGSGFDDYNGLLAVRTLAGQMTTIQWWAMGSNNASQGDCVGGGTATP